MKKVQSRFIEIKNSLIENKDHCFTFLMVYVFGMLVGIQSGYFLLPVLLTVGFFYKLGKLDFYLNETKKRNLFYGIVIAFLMMGIAQMSVARTDHFFIALPSSFGVIECVFFGLVFALFEELFFRGLLLKQLSNKVHPYTALIISTVVFGIYTRSVMGLVMGIALGLLTLKADSLYPSIFANFLLRVLLIYEAFNLDQFAKVLHRFDASGFVYDWGNGLIVLGLCLWCVGIAMKAKKVTE